MTKRKREFTGIVVGHQLPLLEYVYTEHDAEATWRLWLDYDKGRCAGTYLRLDAYGSITRETLMPTGEIAGTAVIKPGG